MSEPFWSALGAPAGAGGVDYEGAWAAGTSYLPGDVVIYQGVNYLAVNPSTGVAPPGAVSPYVTGIGTALPTTPFDGQEFILVDSLTAPTYQWLMRYCAGVADANKWLCLGGTPMSAFIATQENRTSAVLGDLATPGPSLTAPRAGVYMADVATYAYNLTAGSGAQAIVHSNAVSTGKGVYSGALYYNTVSANLQITVGAAGHQVKLMYAVMNAGTASFGERSLMLTPVRLA